LVPAAISSTEFAAVTVFVVTFAVMIDLTTFISRGFALHPLPFFVKGRANHKNQAVNLHKKERWTMQRKKTFLVVCISIVLLGGTRAQNIPSGALFPYNSFSLRTPGQPSPYGIRLPVLPISGTLFSGIQNIPGAPVISFGLYPQGAVFSPKGADNRPQTRLSLQALEDDYYTRHFGFMCKKELELEKTTHIPLRFRLGSLEQCNYLEGKR
jgi:hypothetical protein